MKIIIVRQILISFLIIQGLAFPALAEPPVDRCEFSRNSDQAKAWESVLVLPVRFESGGSIHASVRDTYNEWTAYNLRLVRPWKVLSSFHLDKKMRQLNYTDDQMMEREHILKVAEALEVDGIISVKTMSDFSNMWNLQYQSILTIRDTKSFEIITECKSAETIWDFINIWKYEFQAISKVVNTFALEFNYRRMRE